MQLRKIEHIGIPSAPLSPFNIRVRLVNVLALFSLFTATNYIIVSANTAPPWILITGAFYISILLLIYYLNHRRRYRTATTLLCTTSAIVQSVLIFRYGAEAVYHFVGFLIAIVFLYKSIWIHTCYALWLVTVIAIAKQGTILEASAAMKNGAIYWFNIGTIILYIFILMRYFLKLQDMYRWQIEQQKRAIEALNKQNEELFTIVAHDIRSPLTASTQYIEILSDDENVSDYTRKMLTPVRSTLKTLAKNTENIIHWNKQKTKQQRHTPTCVKLIPIIGDIINSMQIDITEKKIHIEVAISAMVDVFADEEHTRIILYNLLQNALKFSHPGRQVCIKATKKDNAVAIIIQDEGIGVSPDRISTLFTKPHIPAFGTAGERGSGIGLVLIKSLVELNDGHIDVVSEKDVGSTFTLHLPSGSRVTHNNV